MYIYIMNNIVPQNYLNRQQSRFEEMITVINQFGYMINPQCKDPFIPIGTADLLKKMKRKNAWTKRPFQPREENIYFGGPEPVPTNFIKPKMSKRRSRTKSVSKRRNKRSRTKSDPVRTISGRPSWNLFRNNSAPGNIIRNSNKPGSLRGGKRKSKKKKVRNMTKKTKK